jgi:2,5-diketo-D-gluconate reductase B
MQNVSVPGLSMAKLGLGTWRMNGAACTDAVLGALALGYRHIDTAKMYGNEDAVGAALARTDISRADIHVSTKVWPDALAPAAMRRSLEASLAALRIDHVDLFLIHWPTPEMDLPEAITSLMRLRDEGLTRAIGVSNFSVALLRRAVEEVQAPIVCDQIEFHALLDRSKILAYARTKGIVVTAYCPLARGRLSDEPALHALARKHGATPEQIGLKWLLDQDGVAAIPKAARPASQQANLDALSLALDDDDRAVIAALPKDVRLVSPGWAMDWD